MLQSIVTLEINAISQAEDERQYREDSGTVAPILLGDPRCWL